MKLVSIIINGPDETSNSILCVCVCVALEPKSGVGRLFVRFIEHRHTHTHTSGRTPIEWPSRRWDRYLHNAQQTPSKYVRTLRRIRTLRLSIEVATGLRLRPWVSNPRPAAMFVNHIYLGLQLIEICSLAAREPACSNAYCRK